MQTYPSKSILIALTRVYGIGLFQAKILCKKLGFAVNLKVKNLSQEQINDIFKVIELSNIKIGNELKKIKLLISKKLVSIKSYKGLRRNQGLPVRGQRTHTNAQSSKKMLI